MSAPDILTAALHYAERGYHVFPCRVGSKIPATAHGFKDAATDETRIRNWWTNEPRNNVAIATTNCLVLDLDRKHGNDGVDSLERLASDIGIATADLDTWFQTTPNRGKHLFFRIEPGIKCGTDVLAPEYPGIDIRTVGGYVVAAPSEAEGCVYTDCVEDLPRPEDLPPLPKALADALRKPAPKPLTVAPLPPPGDDVETTALGGALFNDAIARIREARPGSRNDTLASVAARVGSLVAQGILNRDQGFNTLVAVAVEEFPDEVEKSVNTIRRQFQHGYTSTLSRPVLAGVAVDTPEKAAWVGHLAAKHGATIEVPDDLADHATLGAALPTVTRPAGVTASQARNVREMLKGAATGQPSALGDMQILAIVKRLSVGTDTRFDLDIHYDGVTCEFRDLKDSDVTKYDRIFQYSACTKRQFPGPPNAKLRSAWHALWTEAHKEAVEVPIDPEDSPAENMKQVLADILAEAPPWVEDDPQCNIGVRTMTHAGFVGWRCASLLQALREEFGTVHTIEYRRAREALGLRKMTFGKVRVWGREAKS